MESKKHSTLPLKDIIEDTIELSDVVSRNLLTKIGEEIGKIKTVRTGLDLREFAKEGKVIDPDFFDGY